MLLTVNLQSSTLDLPTLSLVAVCIAGLLGLFLVIDWLQQRNVRALAWWGSAYLIGASAMALGTLPTPIIKLPAVVAGAYCPLRPLSAPLSGWGLARFQECWKMVTVQSSAP